MASYGYGPISSKIKKKGSHNSHDSYGSHNTHDEGSRMPEVPEVEDYDLMTALDQYGDAGGAAPAPAPMTAMPSAGVYGDNESVTPYGGGFTGSGQANKQLQELAQEHDGGAMQKKKTLMELLLSYFGDGEGEAATPTIAPAVPTAPYMQN